MASGVGNRASFFMIFFIMVTHILVMMFQKFLGSISTSTVDDPSAEHGSSAFNALL